MTPLITVITTTSGNRRKLLERAVNSVLNQTFKDFQYIICDDASTDDTESYVKSLTDPRILYYRRKKNWGNQTRPINEVLPLVKGKFVSFLDSDNEYLVDHLQVLLKSITESPSLDLVYGDRFFIDETGNIPTQIGVFHDFAPQLLLNRNYIDMSDFLVKKECLFYVGGMDERYKRFADWNLLVRLDKAGFKFKRVPIVITKYYYHSDSLSAKVIENKDKPNQPLWNAYELEVRLPYLGKIPEPTVAVYTLTHDRLGYTKESFEKLKQTAGYNYKHVVVDNGSTDGTIEWLENEYKPFKLIKNIENKGISVASNQAVKFILDKIKPDIIIKIDNDAIPLTMGWLKDFVELYKKNHMMVWSPFIEGLKDSPGGSPRIAYGNLNGHLVGMANHLGGIFHVAPAIAYNNWKWDESDPKHGLQDLLFSQYLAKQGFGMAYVEDIRVSHGPTGTDGQYNDYPDYFNQRKVERDPNSVEHWNGVYKDEGLDDPDKRNDIFSFKIIRENLIKGMTLDLGCGSGFLLEYLGGFKYMYGIDHSEEGVKIAKKRCPDVNFQVGDITKLPYKDNIFYNVVSTEVLEHIKDIDKVVSEIYRVLKPGGYSINLLPYKGTIPSSEHVAEYDEKKIREVFKDFSEVETKVFLHPTNAYFINGVKQGNCQLLFVKARK